MSNVIGTSDRLVLGLMLGLCAAERAMFSSRSDHLDISQNAEKR